MTTSTGLIPSRRIVLYGKTVDVLFMEGSLPDAVAGSESANVDLTIARGGATQTFKRIYSGFLVSVHGYKHMDNVVVLPVPISLILPKSGQEIRKPRRDANGLPEEHGPEFETSHKALRSFPPGAFLRWS
jgi:hypothetical protein